MSHPNSAGDRRIPHYDSFRFNEFPVSWAGPHPFRDGFCFGSEDGKLLFTDEEGMEIATGQGSLSSEAVNGLAKSGRWFVVTTRQDITFWGLSSENDGRLAGAGVPIGAHAVTVTSDGHFVFAAGRLGLLSAKPTGVQGDSVTATTTDRETMTFYRVHALRNGGRDILACALRAGGIGVTEFWGSREGETGMKTVHYQDLDVVDVCVLDDNPGSLAIAAVARNGTLILLRFAEPWARSAPVTMKFDSVQGTAYRLLSSGGDLYLLTSKGMYMFGGLAERFLRGEALSKAPTPVLVILLEAVDANLCGDKWLMVVMPDEVRRFDVAVIRRSTPKDLANGEIRDANPECLHPDWQWQGIQQSTRQLAPVS